MERKRGVQSACGCRSVDRRNISTSHDFPSLSSKYYREIGAEMIGNQLIIRVEKDKNKSTKKKNGNWDPPCDCVIPEIRRPSTTHGPRIINAGDNNQILFRIRSRTLVSKDDANYKSEAFAHQTDAAKKGKDPNYQYRTITGHPQVGDPSQSREIHSDHITDGNQEIYLLRIKKKGDPPGQRKRNIELELRTPKPPTPRPVSPIKVRKPEIVKHPEATMEIKKIEEIKSPVEATKATKKEKRTKKKKKK